MTRRAALLARLASLMTEQAQVMHELAALESGASQSTPRPRRKRVVEPPRDPGTVTSLDSERARRALRRAGVPLSSE